MPRPRAALRLLPISVRLGGTFALLFLGLLVVLSTLAYWALGQTLRNEIDGSLVAAVHELRGRPGGEIDDRRIGGVKSPEFDTQLMTASGRVLRASDDDFLDEPLLTPEQVRTVLQDGSLFVDVPDHDGEPHRALAEPSPGERPRVLLVIAELEPVVKAQATLMHLAVGLVPVAGLLAGAAGWLVARRGLRPIARMTEDAERMSARDPFPRLAVPPTDDEVARLGTTLNRMLDRIEDGRRREREFTADASHELRTPLAVLRAELELARNRVPDDGFGRALDSALEESDRLGQLIDDLLLLARTEAAPVAPRELVDVSQVVDGLLPSVRRLAARRGITVSRSGDAVVRADARALGRAVANLLDNAIRHAPDGGTVSVDVVRGRESTAITVTDDGPGIPADERDHVVQRFAQSPRADVPAGGAGLGLAIVTSVAAAHRGTLEIGDPPSGGGVAVTIRLPSAEEDAVEAQR